MLDWKVGDRARITEKYTKGSKRFSTLYDPHKNGERSLRKQGMVTKKCEAFYNEVKICSP